MPKKSYTFILIFLFLNFLNAQKKILKTQFTSEKMVVDGDFNEDSWKNAQIAKDFVMLNPDNGKPEKNNQRTEIKLLYNNDAIFVSAMLFDDEPTKILKEISLRDGEATADSFSVFLNGYNDGQQEFCFIVSAAGVQSDLVYSDLNGEDSSWNAIWESSSKITENGWQVEMKIPYAAIRFPSDSKQTWGINFFRNLRRERQAYTWNLIDAKIPTRSNQAGILEGIENIKTPTRLFLIPYSSFYLNANGQEKTKGEIRGGLDIKYGINDAFTLDAILIPDFGQTKFDDIQLNLGPFEQRFTENRPFFTEGTDLFNKGNLFYSRRIGSSPIVDKEDVKNKLNTSEEITDYPSKVSLLNAIKISGRTKGGLGIGILNAITNPTYAKINNNKTGEVRTEITEPLANYNIVTFDQRFRKNSSVSIINTNVIRNGSFRDANVTALVFDLFDKNNKFNLFGGYKHSYVNDGVNDVVKKGYNTTLALNKSDGKFRYGTEGYYISRNFNIDDLGINFQTHYHGFNTNASYRILNPTKNFNIMSINLDTYTEFDNLTGRVQRNQFDIYSRFRSKKNNDFGGGIITAPIITYDFYEPRSKNEKRFFARPQQIETYCFFSSNYNNKFAFDINPYMVFYNQKARNIFGINVSPRYRFSDKISLIYNFEFQNKNNNTGYVDDDNSDIIFAFRKVRTITNTLQGKYSLNNKMNLNLAIRHYWSYTDNNQYLTLLNDGGLAENNVFNKDLNKNFNSWNLDLSYSWWFAPGSEMSILYRNNAVNSLNNLDDKFNRDFVNNLKSNLNNEKLNHIFSISVRYFIDYNQIKHIL